MSVAAYLRRESVGAAEVEVLNFASTAESEALLHLETREWDGVSVVGVSVNSFDVGSADVLMRRLRSLAPSAALIAGGPHPTLCWRDFMNGRRDVIDAVVVGEGEGPAWELVQLAIESDPPRGAVASAGIPGVATIRGGEPVLVARRSPLDTAQWADPFTAAVWQPKVQEVLFSDRLTGRRRPAVSLVTSRSCPMRCRFCSIVSMGERYRSVSPDTVVEWLGAQRRRSPFEHVYFLDADFFTTRARALSYGAAMSAALPSVTWSVQATVGHVLSLADELPQLVGQGLRAVELGIEAGNDHQLAYFDKRNFGKPATAEQSLAAIRLLRRNRIFVGIDYIMFYPGQALSQLERNASFLLHADLIDEINDGHLWNELILFPGTPIREEIENERGVRFTTDLLPPVDDLYVDERVLRVKREFKDVYRQTFRPESRSVQRRLQSTARGQPDPKLRAVLRLHEVRLRHHPFRALVELIRTEGRDSGRIFGQLAGEVAVASRLLERLERQPRASPGRERGTYPGTVELLVE